MTSSKRRNLENAQVGNYASSRVKPVGSSCSKRSVIRLVKLAEWKLSTRANKPRGGGRRLFTVAATGG